MYKYYIYIDVCKQSKIMYSYTYILNVHYIHHANVYTPKNTSYYIIYMYICIVYTEYTHHIYHINVYVYVYIYNHI